MSEAYDDNPVDLGNIEGYLHHIENKLHDIDRTLHEVVSAAKTKDTSDRGLYDLIWLFAIIFFMSGWSGSKLDRFTDRVWYSKAYDTDWKNVNVGKRPSDCDFLRAPIGTKKCSYKKTKIIYGNKEREALVESSSPEYKEDARKSPNEVMVRWEKVEEP